ncbi:MAG TPA: hypothetical protein PKM27_12260 [Saprospiraceae bacterium]|nr:hypothetical protein [Saprospiraceae bacterium]HNT21730.1 hypothetical protein [Saprospiraceae bacterium]
MKIIHGWICLGLLVSCNSGPSKPKVPPESMAYLNLQQIMALSEQADFVDFLFFNMDVSVSQSDKASISQTVNFFDNQAKPEGMNCPAIGRISFQSGGKIIREADIHFLGTGCGYFTIIENKKPVGTNLISEPGLKFFETLVTNYKPK